MNENIILLHKKLGETPLQAIVRYKHTHNPDDTLSFAGRLDPMAEGLLLVLRNAENKNRQHYEGLPKTYCFSFLTGFATDTYDLLGKITHKTNDIPKDTILQENITTLISTLPGKRTQAYPPFSSYHLKGKPLYYWELRQQLDHSALPTKEIEIYSAKILGFERIDTERVKEAILTRLSPIQGNFRQEEIRTQWQEAFEKTPHQSILLTHADISCSSGTYIRGIVHELGNISSLPMVTYSILRTAIGPYTLETIPTEK